jgi:hypothetical protein
MTDRLRADLDHMFLEHKEIVKALKGFNKSCRNGEKNLICSGTLPEPSTHYADIDKVKGDQVLMRPN